MLEWPEEDGSARPVSQVTPGRLIGDLSVITNEKRQLNLVAQSPCSFLRIGAEELRAVVESDAGVAVQLLETVAGYLTSLADQVNGPQDLADLAMAEEENDRA